MISEQLVKKFIKNYENVENKKVREQYGYLGGIIGIIANLILFSVKLSVGVILNSIAVTADAFNNLSDTVSSLITIVGFKLAAKPADHEHPYGHGRIEYISGLIVSFMVLYVGIEFLKTSISRIITPAEIKFKLIPFILILISISIKVWLSKFNKFMGTKINSSALKASSVDALSDVFSSSVVALSLLASKYVSFPIDGYIGTFISLFILYSGYTLIKDTINPLLGEAPDNELITLIERQVLKNDYILGTHDLVVHNYGPSRTMATIHAEVSSTENIMAIHEVIDEIERKIFEEHNIFLVIHMDPLNIDDNDLKKAMEELAEILYKYPEVKSFHDLRIVGERENKNLIFDIVIDRNSNFNFKDEKILMAKINRSIKKTHPFYEAIITLDRDYS
ncbi:cation diffusion facilitator family transporter [Clostridium sp. DL1XJH146]